jgi:hypothetical protein
VRWKAAARERAALQIGLLQKYGAEISQNGTNENSIDAFGLFAASHCGAGMSGGDDLAVVA